MSKISVLPKEITDWLNQQSVLKDVKFVTEFPAIKKEIPLRNATVAVGIDKMKLEDSFTANDEGVLIENEYCRLATIKIKLSIHIPFKDGGAKCHDVLTKVIDCLTFATDLNVIESGCGDTKADRNTDAFVLDAYLLIGADFCPADSSGVNFKSFLDKEFLCGSHIRNAEIHVTAQDKNFWNRPYIVGSYAGTGETVRSVNVGFKPNFIIVFAHEHPVSTWNNDKKMTQTYLGFASFGGSTVGLRMTNSGFTVNTKTSLASGTFDGNKLGYTYVYIAFKSNK